MKRHVASWLSPLLCVFLLSAQLGAVSHAVWHAAAGGTAHASDIHDGDASHAPNAPELEKLCAFDAAFGQVLGGAAGNCHALTISAGDDEKTLQRVHILVATDPPSPHSRGPPSPL